MSSRSLAARPLRSPRQTPGAARRRAGKGAKAAITALTLGLVLLPTLEAAASRFPPRPELQRHRIAKPPRFQAAQVKWKERFTERGLLEFEPRELAGPAVDPFSGDMVIATRKGEVYLLDLLGQQIWRSSVGAGATTTPTLTDDVVYVGTQDGRLHALDRFNGEPLWDQALGGQVLNPPATSSDLVFVGTDHDAIHALDAFSGETRWIYRRSTPGQLSIRGGSGVSVEGGRAFAGFSDGALVALGAEDGRMLWQARPARGSLERFADADATPVVRGGLVFSTVFHDGVYAYEAATGKLRWRADAAGAHSLTIDGDRLLVGGASKVRSFQLSNGASIWSVDLGETYVVKPVVANKVAMLAGPKGILLVDSGTGEPLDRFYPGSGFSSGPVVINGDIYAFSDLGNLFRLALLVGR